jgi:probable rRNA maturation factor
MILNRQKRVRLARRPFEGFLQRIQRELQLADVDITVAFVSDREMARWNAAYRGKPGPTDVLSFPAAYGARRGVLGDIAIAPETARRYARKNGRTLADEIRVLMLHGVLHLMGYDHESDNGQMNRVEQRLRRRLGIA